MTEVPTIVLDDAALRRIKTLSDDDRLILVVVPSHVDAVTVHFQEPEPLDAADVFLLREIRRANRDTGDPVNSTTLACDLRGWSEGTIRTRLMRLERRGDVLRPHGERSGYSLTKSGLDIIEDALERHPHIDV